MKLTKRRDVGGQWRVYADGRRTSMVISKSDPPRYREPQMYWLDTDDGVPLIEAPGVGAIMSRLERISQELAKSINHKEGR